MKNMRLFIKSLIAIFALSASTYAFGHSLIPPKPVCGHVIKVANGDSKFSVQFEPEEYPYSTYVYMLTSYYVEIQRALQQAHYRKERICVTGYDFPGFEAAPAHVFGATSEPK